MKPKLLLGLALVLSGGLFGCASNHSTVTVIDSATGKPVAGAQVLIITRSAVSKPFMTNQHGTTELRDIKIAPDGFDVQVSKPGYGQTSQGIWGVRTNHLEILLRPESKP
jgi:hypothetical protein